MTYIYVCAAPHVRSQSHKSHRPAGCTRSMRSILIDFGQGKQSQLAWLLVGQIPIRIRCPQQRIECAATAKAAWSCARVLSRKPSQPLAIKAAEAQCIAMCAVRVAAAAAGCLLQVPSNLKLAGHEISPAPSAWSLRSLAAPVHSSADAHGDAIAPAACDRWRSRSAGRSGCWPRAANSISILRGRQ